MFVCCLLPEAVCHGDQRHPFKVKPLTSLSTSCFVRVSMLASQLKIMNPLIILPMTKMGRKGICK